VKGPAAAKAVFALSLAHCGGGLPLLHPAQTMDPGEVRATTGFSASVATGELSTAVRAANAAGSTTGSARMDESYVRGILATASVGPGLAPVVGARVGVARATEAGLAYTARAVRADARHSFGLSRSWALSLGAGASAVLRGQQVGDMTSDVDLGPLHGWGADVPVLVGYSSEGDLYRVWVGARAGVEQIDLSAVQALGGSSAAQAATAPISLSAMRVWGGGLLGLAVGFRHTHVAMELDICYANVAGKYGGTHASVAGATLAPASSLWWDF
jgi:hypothetical protein